MIVNHNTNRDDNNSKNDYRPMWPCDDGAQEGSNVETCQMCLEPGKFFFSYFKKTSLTFFYWQTL